MSSLREGLIRLAHEHPELRAQLVPLLRRQAMEFPSEEALQRYLKEHPDADKARHTVKEMGKEPAKEDPAKENAPDKEPPGDKPKPEGEKPKGKNVKVPPKILAKFEGDIPEYKLEIIAGEGEDLTEADLRRAKAVKSRIKNGIGAAADICKMSPPVCEDNMGIYRSHMPQIPEESIKSLLKSEKEGDRKKGQAAVDAGADPEDDRPMTEIFMDWLKGKGTKVSTGEKVAVGQLKATQREIKAGKTFGMADAYFSGTYDPTKKPIIVSSDNHILDGHHRWAAMLTADPEAEMKVIRVGMPMKKILEKSFSMPGVFRADLQDSVVDSKEPLDLNRKPGSTWKQKSGWYAKNQKGKASGPFKDKDAAQSYAEGKPSKKVGFPLDLGDLLTE